MLGKPTRRRASQERLEHERLTSLINSMADGVIAVDEKGKIVIYNGAALNLLDINKSITGKTLSSILHLSTKEGEPVGVASLIADTKTAMSSRDYRITYSGDDYIDLYLSIAPVHLGYGKEGQHGHVLLLRDITREKSLEEERDEFISVVSHELRTPIAITEGNISNAEFIAEKTGDINQIKLALKQAHEQVQFLSNMVNDLSTLSRAERGKLVVEVEPINAHDLVQSLAAEYSKQAEPKGLEIRTDIDPHLELLHSSTLYVREVLQNFITNAIKYTEKGHVTIGAHNKPGGVQFIVQDTGIGISKADQKKIFTKFFRSEDYRLKGTSGTGLGLYVTQKLAKLLGAQIELDSELNHGSTFRIFIPNLQTQTSKSS